MTQSPSIRADEKFMRAALAEARRGLGRTHPNPTVGAVIVRAGRIIARGWHRAAGEPHAEIEALRQLPRPPRGATIYVTLEPCSTQGRTPPCTAAIAEAGIRRVVYGATDPNPRHAGRATEIFARAGIAVTSGVLAVECGELNHRWNKWIATGLPYVIAKAGMTLDGRIASPPESRWITSPAARRDAMNLRASVQAILVGGETVRVDNPRLTIRGSATAAPPVRAVWTRGGALPADARIFTDEFRHLTRVFRGVSLRQTLRELGKSGVVSVLIEGGARVLGEAFDRNLVDEVCFYLAPLVSGGPTPTVGGTGAAANNQAIAVEHPVYQKIGPDVRLSGRIVRTGSARG